jgi:hypothetical protein
MRPWASEKSTASVNSSLTLRRETEFQRPSRLMAGLALSFALHAALLFAWRQGRPDQRAEPPAPTSIAVWLQPPPPPPKTEPAVPTAAATAKATPGARARRRSAPALIAITPSPEAPPAPDAFTVEPPAAPHFDPEAARRFARKIANDPNPARADTAVGQIPPKPLETETKAARAIARAKRRDCKDGIPGGLLAPLYLMMDKKDSGCKW